MEPTEEKLWPVLGMSVDPGYEVPDGFRTTSTEPTIYAWGELPEGTDIDEDSVFDIAIEVRDPAEPETTLASVILEDPSAGDLGTDGSWVVPSDLLVADRDYEVRLRAQSADDHDSWSGWYGLAVVVPPPAPTLSSPGEGEWVVASSAVTATVPPDAPAGQATVVFEFQRFWEFGAPITRTQYSEADANGVATTAVPYGYPFTEGQVRWRAKWINGLVSEWSDFSTFAVGKKPVAPTVHGSGTALLLNLSWTQPSSYTYLIGSEFDVTLERDGVVLRELTVGNYQTHTAFEGITPGIYTATVVARNPLGSSPAGSTTVEVTPTHPGTPENVSLEMLGLVAELSWDAPPLDGGSPIVRYDVIARNTSDYSVASAVSTTATTVSVPGLLAGREYLFAVDAVNAEGSNRAFAGYGVAFDVPDAPTSVQTVIGDGFIDVYWDAPPSDNGSPVTSYIVSASPGSDAITVPGRWGRQGARIYDLTNGEDYVLTVHAVNAAGPGAGADSDVTRPMSDSTDNDADGLPDVVELRVGSDVSLPDSDLDGISDAEEVLRLAGFTSPVIPDTDGDGTSDADGDIDGDGISNLDELDDGLSPISADSDDDGLGDNAERAAGTDPLGSDTDGDGVPDGWEVDNGIDPLSADSDSDGVSDSEDEISRSITATVTDQAGTVLDGEAVPDLDPGQGGIAPAVAVVSGTPLANADVRVNESRAPPVVAAITGAVRVTSSMVGDEVEGNDAIRTSTRGRATTAASSAASVSEVRLGYSSLVAENRLSNLAPVAWNEETSTWDFVDNNVTVSTANRTITITDLELGLTYAVVDLDAWTAAASVCGGDGPGSVLHEVEILVDATGSMDDADPTGARYTALRTVIGSLPSTSLFSLQATTPVGVISSRGTSDFIQPNWWELADILRLHPQSPSYGSGATPVEEALKWVDDIEAAGVGDDDSYLGDAQSAYAELWLGGRRSANFPQGSCASKSIVLVTDGAWQPPAERDPYDDEDYVPFRQSDTPVHVLDVGVGDEEDRDWLIQLADDTGGTYSYVPTATDLASWIEDVQSPEPPLTDDTSTDSDSDGLSDRVEQHGIRSTMFPGASSYLGRTVFTDAQLSDTDSDGLTDSEEAGAVLVPVDAGIGWNNLVPVSAFALNSDPTSEDGDGDGLNDASEVEFNLNPLVADNDFDGLNDGDEEFYGTYSTLADSDFDGFSDGYEAGALDDGYDPVEFTKEISGYEWLSDLGLGMFCGEIDVCRKDSIPWLVGNIVSGVLVFGDVRDAVAGAIAGDLPVFSIAVIGIIPGFGDLGSGVRKVVKAVERSADSEFSSAALKLLYKQADNATYLRQIDEIAPTLVGDLRGYAVGITDDVLARLINANGIDRMKMMMSSSSLKSPSYGNIAKPPADLGWRGAEHYLHDLVGVPGFKQTAEVVTINGVEKRRFFDAIIDLPDDSRMAFEAKVGFARNAFVKFQAVKDAAIKAAGGININSIEWHFFASSRTGKIGMSKDVLDTLEAAGIKFVLHITGE